MVTERNPGYRDGLEGRGNPSNGDWNAWRQGTSLREQRQFFADVERQREPPAPSFWPSGSSSPRQMSDDEAAIVVAIIAFLFKIVWVVTIFTVMMTLVMTVLASRAVVHIVRLLRHIPERWSRWLGVRYLEPVDPFLEKVQTRVITGGFALIALAGG